MPRRGLFITSSIQGCTFSSDGICSGCLPGMREGMWENRVCRSQTVRRRLPEEEIGKDTGGWKRRLYQRIPVAVWSVGIAAMIVILWGLGLIFYSENQAGGSGEWSCYEGSYVEVGGKRISDVKQIMPCIIGNTGRGGTGGETGSGACGGNLSFREKEIEEKELLVKQIKT